MKDSLPRLFLVAGLVLALDLWTKHWATLALAGRPPLELVGEFVRLTYTRNPGVAFGLGAGFPFPYYLFSIAAAVGILWLFLRQRVPGPARRFALALILGGALGNLVDRLSSGEVVDFIEVGWGRWHWPVFNVADSAVSVGVVLFALTWPRHAPADGAATGGAPGSGGELEPDAARADAPSPAPGDHEHDAGAGSVRSVVWHRGAAGSLPGRGADGPLA